MDPFSFDRGCGPSIEGDNRNVSIIREESFADFPSVWTAFSIWDGMRNALQDANTDVDRRYELRIRNRFLDPDELGHAINTRKDMTEYVKHNLNAGSSKHVDLLLRGVGDVGDNNEFPPEALRFDLMIYAFYNERCGTGAPFLHMNATKRKLDKTYGPNGSDKTGARNCLGRAIGMRVILWDNAGDRRPGMWLTSPDGKVSHTSGYWSKYEEGDNPFKAALKKLVDHNSHYPGDASTILRDRDAIFDHLKSSIRVNNGLTADDTQFVADTCGVRIRLHLPCGKGLEAIKDFKPSGVNFKGEPRLPTTLVINLILHSTSHVGLLSPLGDESYHVHDVDKDLEDDVITETAVVEINFDPDKKLVCDEVFQVEYRSGAWLEAASRNAQPEIGTTNILGVRVMPRKLPVACVPEGFSDDVNMRTEIHHGGIVYRHEVFEDYQTHVLGQKPGTNLHRNCPTMVHHLTQLLGKQLQFHNCNTMSYNDDPSAFLAVKASIVTIAHRYEAISEETSKVDMKMAYGAEYGPAFAKLGISPYFHGYVRNGCMAWQEAPACSVYMQGRGIERPNGDPFTSSLIGNTHPCDIPFTWRECVDDGRLGRFAFFAIYELDLSDLCEPLRSNLLKLKMFPEHYLYSEADADLFLASPIIHYLESLGARWRALGVTVSNTAGYTMFPHRADEPVSDHNMTPDIIRDYFERTKAYSIIVGMARSSFSFEHEESYIVPDEDTCNLFRKCARDGLLRSRMLHSGSSEVGAPIVDKLCIIKDREGKSRIVDSPPQISHAYYGGYNDTKDKTHKVVINKYKNNPTVHPWVACQLSYQFVVMIAALAILPEDKITSLRLDEIGTSMSVDELAEWMVDFIHPGVPGTFKPPTHPDESDRDIRNMSEEFVSNTRGLSNSRYDKMYTVFMGTYPYRSMLSPPAKHLWWSSAQNQMSHVTYITGPAGSGKTTGLFSNANWAIVRGQSVWNEKTLFATLTNNLANAITANVDMPGARGRTVFNFCNRKVAEKEGQLSSPTQRSHKFTDNRAYNNRQMSLTRCNKFQSRSLARYSTVVLDECNLNQHLEFQDAIEVAGAHHLQIIIVCDYDDQMDAFKQLYSINYDFNIKSPSYMRDIVSEFLGGSIHTGRIELVDVYRQKDPLLKNLLTKLRGMSGDSRSQLSTFETLCVSPLASDGEHVFNPVFAKPMDSYADKLPRFPIFVFDEDGVPPIRPNQTKIVSPRHKMLEKMGMFWLNSMSHDVDDDDLIEVMWYECGQTKKTATGPWTDILAWFDNGLDYVCKYDTAMVSWKELRSPEVCAIWPKFPYHKENRVNLSMFRTPFALQGTELRPGDDLIMLWNRDDKDEADMFKNVHGWHDPDQPNAIYVVLSRALDHTQIKVVHLL